MSSPTNGAVLPTGEEKRTAVTAMFDRIASRYDRVNKVISLGQDRRWRRHTIAALDLPAGARVLDLACGTGDLCRDAARVGLRPIGVDLSVGMLAAARATAPLVLADALALPVPDGHVDGVVSGFALRNFTDLSVFLEECARVLRPGGRVALLDAAVPERALMRAGNAIWFRRIVPWIGGLLADRDAYRYLPASTAYLPPGAELVTLVEASGFADVGRVTMMGGSVQLLSGRRT